MRQLGNKTLIIQLQNCIDTIPLSLQSYQLQLLSDGYELHYSYDMQRENHIADLLSDLDSANLKVKDLHSSESSLEDIFVNLVKT